ncbi:site-specific integrase [Mesorhizobium sp. BR-1-1-8]|uniref:tyrosine-type recombinase/integrase n=1 Tax=Mesorhizobium sp. BR-1-1-8 TaxID=2876659 RepID=UPI001CCC1EEB|nr:site-specific integrase [Mesorhizobium sp. BR-1-1-8]MBZ9984757.1 site-specific integrase [Mesorhizobium sp. BR-1-1-8]
MASIIERRRKDGTSSFLAQIVVKRDGKTVHRENKTFAKRREAAAWGAFREGELSKPGVVEDMNREDPTLAEAIARYEREAKRLGRTKAAVLKSLKDFDISSKRCSEIRSEHIVTLARELAKTRRPSTVAGYLTFLSGVFKLARPAWGYPLDEKAMTDATTVASKLEMTGRSNQRDRRPSVDEMTRLMKFFSGRKVDSLPMERVSAFALYSARREGEIVRLRWDDLDETHSRILVRDAKDPRGSSGNNIWTELTPEALAIIKSTPRTGDLIFPYKGDTINFAWRNACNILDIKDLKFHDLRHEGVSRLFELGRTIPQVASVSGHRSWQNLQRYTHIRETGDKWAGWKWLEIVAPQREAA